MNVSLEGVHTFLKLKAFFIRICSVLKKGQIELQHNYCSF